MQDVVAGLGVSREGEVTQLLRIVLKRACRVKDGGGDRGEILTNNMAGTFGVVVRCVSRH